MLAWAFEGEDEMLGGLIGGCVDLMFSPNAQAAIAGQERVIFGVEEGVHLGHLAARGSAQFTQAITQRSVIGNFHLGFNFYGHKFNGTTDEHG